MSVIEAVDNVFRGAVGCQHCFVAGFVQHALVDLPQPPWVGTNYERSMFRILVLQIKPGGAGEPSWYQWNTKWRELLAGYQGGNVQMPELLAYGVDWMLRGRFNKFFLEGVGLNLDRIAVANIAWCSSLGNDHPKRMLDTCMAQHTRELLRVLEPNCVLLSGHRTHKFKEEIERILPNVCVEKTWNYAHRRSNDDQAVEIRRLRRLIPRNQNSARPGQSA